MVSNRRIGRQDACQYWFVFVLTVLFGSVSWLSVNSMWLQLPLLVQELPEGWNLPSFLTVIVQLAGVGALIYGLVKRLALSSQFDPAPLICVLILVCILCHLLLVWFWHSTTWVLGTYRSVALFIIFFGVSVVDCTSNVLFMPYMALFKPSLMPAYFVGMGVSSLVPSLIALIQGSGAIECVYSNVTNSSESHYIDPAFSVGAYNGVIAAWVFISLFAFIALNWSKIALTQRVTFEKKNSSSSLSEENSLQQNNHNHANNAPYTENDVEVVQPQAQAPDPQAVMPTKTYLILLLLTSWVCALMNGVLPAIQSYSALPYGQTVYHLVAVFSNLANPVACFIPFFVQVNRKLLLVSSIGTGLVTVISAYIIATAALSPDSILMDTPAGAVICVLFWVLAFGLMAYLRTVMAAGLRCASGNSENRLFWCGAFTQLGSFLGALVMFPLINIWHFFSSATPCN